MRANNISSSDKHSVISKAAIVTTVEIGAAKLNTVSHHKYLRCAKFVNPMVRQLSVETGLKIDLQQNRNSLIVIDNEVEEVEREIALERDVYEEKLESELETSLETIIEPDLDTAGYESDSEESVSTNGNTNTDIPKQIAGPKEVNSSKTNESKAETNDLAESHTGVNRKVNNNERLKHDSDKNKTITQVAAIKTVNGNVKVKHRSSDDKNNTVENNNLDLLSVETCKNTGNESESELLNEIYRELNKRSEDTSADNLSDDDELSEDVWVHKDDLNESNVSEIYDLTFSDDIQDFKTRISGSKDDFSNEIVEYNVDKAISESKITEENTALENRKSVTDANIARTTIPSSDVSIESGKQNNNTFISDSKQDMDTPVVSNTGNFDQASKPVFEISCESKVDTTGKTNDIIMEPVNYEVDSTNDIIPAELLLQSTGENGNVIEFNVSNHTENDVQADLNYKKQDDHSDKETNTDENNFNYQNETDKEKVDITKNNETEELESYDKHICDKTERSENNAEDEIKFIDDSDEVNIFFFLYI